MRLDKALVERGLAKTRSQAKNLIENNFVQVNDKTINKLSFKVTETDELKIEKSEVYVSRGAYKLKHALEQYSISIEGLIAADIGASTGGFTQVLLENGAKKVYCVDVGHDQLAQELKDDDRVINIEKTNIKYPLSLEEQVDLFVCDVSFISLKLIFKNMVDLLGEKGRGIVLIKPQFEAGKERIGKNGLVSDKDREVILKEMKDWFDENDFLVSNIIKSPVSGNKSGNIEYLALYTKD